MGLPRRSAEFTTHGFPRFELLLYTLYFQHLQSKEINHSLKLAKGKTVVTSLLYSTGLTVILIVSIHIHRQFA